MACILKRKRSESELSFSSSTTLSSPSKLAASVDFSTAAPGVSETFASIYPRGYRAPSHLNSRTMKRSRNGRPSDAEVYERTLGLLYSAQGSAHHEPMPPHEHTSQDGSEDSRDGEAPLPPSAPQNMDDCVPPNQPSLHRFWDVSRPATHRPRPQAASAAPSRTDIAMPNGSDHCMMDGIEVADPEPIGA